MWGCNFTSFGGGWGGGFFPGSLWTFLTWGLAIVLLAYLAARLFRSGRHDPRGASRDCGDSLAILSSRLARGEISPEEYARMRQALSIP